MNGMNTYNENPRICPVCKCEHKSLNSALCPTCAKRQMLAKKKKRTRAIARLSFLALAFIVALGLFVSLVISVFSNSETLVAKSSEYKNSPVFYTLENDEVYYLSPKNESIFLGTGEIQNFVCSFDGKTVYALLCGKLDKDSHADENDFLLKIENFKNVSTVANAGKGSINFVSSLDAEYIYYLINEETKTDELSSRLYVLENGKEPERIALLGKAGENPCLTVSPNGRYLVFATEDGVGTKLVKYCAQNGDQISLGVKNCLPVSIDNKGEYFSYIKQNTEELYDFYLETDVENRQKVSLSCSEFNKIVVSGNMRSFAIDVGAYTSFKSANKDSYSVLTNKESTFGYSLNENARLSLVGEIANVLFATDTELLPYSFYDNENKNIVYIPKSGEKVLCFNETFDDFEVSENHIAYVFSNGLYFGKINGEKSKSTAIIPNFSSFSLRALSGNGKYVFYSDSDGNLFRCTKDGKSAIKLAVDVEDIEVSKDGEQFIYTSDSVLILRNKNGRAQSIDSNILAEHILARNNDFSSLVYVKYHTENSVTTQNADLYAFGKKGITPICENVKSILGLSENRIFEN